MELNGKEDLNTALLQHPNGVADTAFQIKYGGDDAKIRTVVFKVSGMTCSSCATSVESALVKLDGIKSVMVSPLQGQAVVKYSPELITVSQIYSCSCTFVFIIWTLTSGSITCLFGNLIINFCWYWFVL